MRTFGDSSSLDWVSVKAKINDFNIFPFSQNTSLTVELNKLMYGLYAIEVKRQRDWICDTEVYKGERLQTSDAKSDLTQKSYKFLKVAETT